VRPPDALRRRTHLSGGRADSIPTVGHDADRTSLSCLAGGVNKALDSNVVNVIVSVNVKFKMTLHEQVRYSIKSYSLSHSRTLW